MSSSVLWLDKAENYQAGGVAALVFTKPASLAVGDLMVVHVATSNTTGPPSWSTTETGWTEKLDSGGQAVYYLYIADATQLAAQPSTYTFTCSSGNNEKAGNLSRFSGAHPTTPIDVCVFSTPNQGTPVCPTATSTGRDELVWQTHYSSTSLLNSLTAPAGTTKRFDDSPGTASYIGGGDITQAAAGATGTFTWVEGSSGANWWSATVVINGQVTSVQAGAVAPGTVTSVTFDPAANFDGHALGAGDAGDLLVAILTSSATVKASVVGPAGWTYVDAASGDASGTCATLWYKICAASESSWVWSGLTSGNASVEISQYHDAAGGQWTLDKTNKNTPTTTTSTTPGTTGTLTKAVEVAVAYACQPGNSNGGGEAITAPFTLLAPATSTPRIVDGYSVTNVTTALNPTISWTTSRVPVAGIASFYPLVVVAKSSSDTGSGADAGSLTAATSGAETSIGTDAGSAPPATTSSSETRTATDSGAVAAAVPGADTSAGADAGSLAAAVPGTETSTGTDAGAAPPATTSTTETGSGADSGTLAATVPSSETSSGSDAESVAAAIPGADTSNGSDGGTVSAATSTADTGSGADAGTLAAALSNPETAAGTETGAATAATSNSDTGASVEGGTVAAAASSSDTSTGADAGTLAATTASTETATSVESASVAAMLADTDIGSTVDNGTLAAALGGSETASSTETGTLAAATSSSENGTGLDVGALVALIFSSDLAAGIDSEVVAVAVASIDTGSGTDSGFVAVAVYATDTGGAVELGVVVVIVKLTATSRVTTAEPNRLLATAEPVGGTTNEEPADVTTAEPARALATVSPHASVTTKEP